MKGYWKQLNSTHTTDLVTLTMDQQAEFTQEVNVKPRFRRGHAITVRTFITVMDIGTDTVSLALDREIFEVTK